MNILKRSITSELSLFSHPSRKWRLLLYSTTYTLKPPKSPKRTQISTPLKPSSSPPKVEALKLPDWPRPSEIPYQPKVANLVNLIGNIKAPVKFWTSPDGKHWACTVIYQEDPGENPCLIPAVFEGDLAHVVTFHVKENDCVYVIGRLSEDPLPLVLSETPGKLHLRVQNINFVQGFEKKRSGKTFGGNLSSGNDEIVITSKECKSDLLSEKGAAESIVAPGGENYRTSITSTGTKKSREDSGLEPWRDLVQNSREWRDYRGQKSKGFVSNKYPDFKHKYTGAALWLDKAPEWVLGGIENLEFEVPASSQKQVKDAREALLRSLAENPSDWWDNRLNKKNPKSPDFKHKTSGESLWLNNLPDWVLSKLPPLDEKQNVHGGRKDV